MPRLWPWSRRARLWTRAAPDSRFRTPIASTPKRREKRTAVTFLSMSALFVPMARRTDKESRRPLAGAESICTSCPHKVMVRHWAGLRLLVLALSVWEGLAFDPSPRELPPHCGIDELPLSADCRAAPSWTAAWPTGHGVDPDRSLCHCLLQVACPGRGARVSDGCSARVLSPSIPPRPPSTPACAAPKVCGTRSRAVRGRVLACGAREGAGVGSDLHVSRRP